MLNKAGDNASRALLLLTEVLLSVPAPAQDSKASPKKQPLPSNKKSKFGIPVWHPEAR